MPPAPTTDGRLQSRKPLTSCFAGHFRRNDSISGIHFATLFQIHLEVKRMARTTLRILIRILLTLASAGSVYAQNHAQPPAQVLGRASTQTTASQSAPAPTTDLSQIQGQALVWLQDLIRINTTNPPGNELVPAKYLAGVLDREGIHSETFESTPGRGFLVARLSANSMPDPSRALLLMAHLDVVGVDKAKWTVDPFGAVIQGNYLYGRGAIDDKGMVIACLATFIQLKRSNARLNRDVIFLAEPDEEAGGTAGMHTIAEKYWDKIAAGFALNEGGAVRLKGSKTQYIAVQASEKVAYSVDVIAKGTSGHASMPRPDDPVTHLAAAMAKIGAY